MTDDRHEYPDDSDQEWLDAPLAASELERIGQAMIGPTFDMDTLLPILPYKTGVLPVPKGKNFSANNASGKRRKADFYETPYSLTRLLLEEEVFPRGTSILEPACGNGAIVKVLTEFGYGAHVTAYDLSTGTDFLQETRRFDVVFTNPPFSLAQEFIQHAKTLSNKIIFLLPLSYLHGKERYDTLYNDSDFPLKRLYVFTRYPMLGDELREDGKHRTGMMVYAWFVFERKRPGDYAEPVIRWLDNHKYVIGARTK